jgi:hypothetical protein
MMLLNYSRFRETRAGTGAIRSVVAVWWNSNCIVAALFDEIGMQMNIDTFICISPRLTLKTALMVGTTRS